jgi:ABC-type amino acid transport system permease subunit
VAYARSRLRTIGACAAYLAWTTAMIELLGTPLLFAFDFPEIQSTYLQIHGETMPLLLAPGYQASSLAIGLVLVVEMILSGVSVLALALTGLFFHRLSKGQTWTSSNIKLLWWVGLLCIGTPLLWPVTYTLQGLALAIDLPAGERSFNVSIGVSSQAVYEIMKGILLCAFSLLMRDAKTISDEHNCYV